MKTELIAQASPAIAISIGRPAYGRISSSGPAASVHSSYNGAINVQTCGGLVCLVSEETGRGPLNINLVSEAFDEAGSPSPGSPVTIGKDLMVFEGGFAVSIPRSNVYSPLDRFRDRVLPFRRIERNVRTSKDVALIMGHLSGVGELLLATEERVSGGLHLNPFSATAFPHLNHLLWAIKEKDVAQAVLATKNLAGLGIGLTPSADDMLSGIMVSLVLASHNGIGDSGVRKIAKAMAGASNGRTTALSAEFLQQAASGGANERLTDLVEVLFTGSRGEVREATLDVLSIGETSGTDLVVGTLLGVRTAIATDAEMAA